MTFELLPPLVWAFAPTAMLIAILAFVLKVFPDLMGKFLFKAVEQRTDSHLAKLRDELARGTAVHVENLKAGLARNVSLEIEAAKAELQTAYSTLRTSVDIVSAGQSGLRTEIIGVAREMWKAIVRYRSEFGDLYTFYGILKTSEIKLVFSDGKPPQIASMIERYHDENKVLRRLEELRAAQLDEGRLFVGEKLWLIFHSTRMFHFRIALLTSFSMKHRKYQDWCTDSLIGYALNSVLTADTVAALKAQLIGGVPEAIGHFEAEFLREANRVMSGSSAFATSLSDIQATLQTEHQRVAERRKATGIDEG